MPDLAEERAVAARTKEDTCKSTGKEEVSTTCKRRQAMYELVAEMLVHAWHRKLGSDVLLFARVF